MAWKAETKKKEPSVGRAILFANREWLLTNISGQLVLVILRVLAPVLLAYLLDWFADPDTVPSLMSPTKDGYLWALFYALAIYAFVTVAGPRAEIVCRI